MQPSNNIFIGGSDPLLGSTPSYGSINSQIAELDALKAQLGQKMQYVEQLRSQLPNNETQQVSRTPIWDEIDSIIQEFSDVEFDFVSNNDEFVESSKKIAEILQSAYMEMMRPIVEGSKKGKDALEYHLTLVKRLKKAASSEANKQMADFQEYTAKYADMPYSEYLKMKKQPKGGKK